MIALYTGYTWHKNSPVSFPLMKKSRWLTLCSLDIAGAASSPVGWEFRKQVPGPPAPGSPCLTQTPDPIAAHGWPLGPQASHAEALNLSRFPSRTESDIGTSVHARDFWWKNLEVK